MAGFYYPSGQPPRQQQPFMMQRQQQQPLPPPNMPRPPQQQPLPFSPTSFLNYMKAGSSPLASFQGTSGLMGGGLMHGTGGAAGAGMTTTGTGGGIGYPAMMMNSSTAPGSLAGSGGGMWSSAGSAGPVGLMILATLLAQKKRDDTFGEGGSTGGNIFDMFMPSVTSNYMSGNWKNLMGQALGLNPITTWIWPSKGPSEGGLLL